MDHGRCEVADALGVHGAAGRLVVQPRMGMADPDEMAAGIAAVAGLDCPTVATVTIDSYTRVGDHAAATRALRSGAALNGFPIVAHGPERTARVAFPWKADTWYVMKLEVQSIGAGKVRARGKVWPAGSPEPEAWLVERVDPIGNRQGSPGIFGNALAEIFFDNLKVYANQ